jgi:hypothetical protein
MAFIGLAAALASFGACSNKMEEKDCDKLRGDAFEMLNKGQHCSTDADCRQSEWPGCQKPLSQATFDKIKPMEQAYQKGKCEEPKVDCKPPPEVYCKQGLCTFREKGTNENLGNTPSDQIIIQ